MSLCGPAGEQPMVQHDVEVSQAERLAEVALSEPSHHAATRLLLANLPELDSPMPGLRNVGLLATQELRAGVPDRPDWRASGERARRLLGLRGRQLVESLGYGIEVLSTNTSMLTINGRNRAIAVFCDEDEPFDAPAQRFNGTSPVSQALAVADQKSVDWVILTRSSEIRLYAARSDTGVGRKGRAETFVELNLSLLPAELAGYLHLLFSADALMENGTLETILDRSADFAAELAVRLRERVYFQTVPALSDAVARRLGRNPTGADLEDAYEQVMVILFRLLFVAYAEDKDGDLHRWMRQIGHDGRLFKSASDPVEVHSMAQRLSSEERVRVDEMARAGVDVDEMARRLDRHRSTVHRELKRCGGRCGYDAEAAQAAADLRARRPKTPKLAGDPVLAAAVGGLLADRMSPHAISAQLRSEGHGICAETVYAACYDHSGARGLPEGSWKLLPRRCRKRRPRGRHARKPSPLGDFKAISQRPASVEDRRQPGHWEGDLIIGKANRSAVATLVERTSRQTLTVALPHGYDAHNTAAAVTAALARQPRHLVKTLTWDQGREMARWPDIEATLGIEVYFCDPHSPWQRPTNEQTNGLLRRWLPKSTDLNVGAVRLAIIEDHLNTMPRKLHDWNSAHSVYAALCRNHR